MRTGNWLPIPSILYKSRHRKTFNKEDTESGRGEGTESWLRALSSQKGGPGAFGSPQAQLQVDAVALKAAECLACAGAGVAARVRTARD